MSSEAVLAADIALPRDYTSRGAASVQLSECRAIILIALFFVFRTVLAASLGLSPGEAYGIGISHVLKLSYYDHPPLSYWIAHEFIPVLGDGRALRLPFVAMFAGTSWALFLLTRQLFGPIAGVWASSRAQFDRLFYVRERVGAAGRAFHVKLDGRSLYDLKIAFSCPWVCTAVALAYMDNRRDMDWTCRPVEIPSRPFCSRAVHLPPVDAAFCSVPSRSLAGRDCCRSFMCANHYLECAKRLGFLRLSR